MIIVKATRDSEAGVMPEDVLIAEMGRYSATKATLMARYVDGFVVPTPGSPR